MHPERHEERWLIRLPGHRLAWLAASTAGRDQIEIEHRVLRLLQQRCTFPVPRILWEAEDVSVRSMVQGLVDSLRIHARLRADPEFAKQIGAALGAILAEQHAKVHFADIAAWIPRKPGWPLPDAWILPRLPLVTDDAQLIADAHSVLTQCAALTIPDQDHALVHSDLVFHNIAVDPDSPRRTRRLRLFRCRMGRPPLRFPVSSVGSPPMNSWMPRSSKYESMLDYRMDRHRIALYNAASAITFLAYCVGTAPDQRPGGRTLAEDLRWSRQAVAAALNR